MAKKEKLRNLIDRLRNGDGVRHYTEYWRTQYGDRIEAYTIDYHLEGWKLVERRWGINCRSSKWYDLGNCHCCSHDPAGSQVTVVSGGKRNSIQKIKEIFGY